MKNVENQMMMLSEDERKRLFLNEVVSGLNGNPKRLFSKYFYDKEGDLLFQKIMSTHDYYPTRCEMEILKDQSVDILRAMTLDEESLEVVELGAGDATKSIHLLNEVVAFQERLNYLPIDISEDVIQNLQTFIPQQNPLISVQGKTGEYFEVLNQLKDNSSRRRLILFLGSSIGNMDMEAIKLFIGDLRKTNRENDYLLIGFDLIKEPEIILRAYNDSDGYTRLFNLNLLTRINWELGGDFNLHQFEHFPIYDTSTGACYSYLVSMMNQEVRIGEHTFHFSQKEMLLMEQSQKFSIRQIEKLAETNGFSVVRNFYDEKGWFVDSLWQVK